MPLLDYSVEADFKKSKTSAHLSKLHVEFPDLEKWTLPRGPASQFGDEYYLGQWDHLFAKPSKEPIPSWDALLWLGKDHPIDIAPPFGLLSNRRFRENHLFSLTPPSQVIIDSRFCGLTHRRYPSKMDQKLDDVWYNFCLMDGEFDSPSNSAFSHDGIWKRWISHLTGSPVVSVAPIRVSSPSPPSVRSPQALSTRSQPVSPPVFRASSPVGVPPRTASVPRSQLGVAKTAVLRPVAKGISIQNDPSPSPSGSSVQIDPVSKGKGPMSEPKPKKLRKL